jgi:regulator of protease activity HflC (stomatin/prohibitin superfamily)
VAGAPSALGFIAGALHFARGSRHSGSEGGFGDDLTSRFEEAIRGMRGSPASLRGWAIAIVVVAALLFLRPFVVIPYGEGGVVFSSITGVKDTALPEGFHVIVPLVDHVTRYDTKIQNYTMSRVPSEGDVFGDDGLQALTSDGQKVRLDVTVRFRLDPAMLPQLHRAVGRTYGQRVVRPEARSVVRMVAARHPVRDFTSSARETIGPEIRDQLATLLAASYITLGDVMLVDVQFSPEFQAAVEEKQKALQAAEQMDYRITETRREAQRVVVQAQGEAAAIAERGEALRLNPLVIQSEYASKIAPNVSGMVMTPADIERIYKSGQVQVPPVPEIRTPMADAGSAPQPTTPPTTPPPAPPPSGVESEGGRPQ